MESSSLWRHANFLRFWSANIISDFGSGITWLALPIIGAVTLEAAAAQMELLSAAGKLPYLLLGLPVGVFVDQQRERPLPFPAQVCYYSSSGSTFHPCKKQKTA